MMTNDQRQKLAAYHDGELSAAESQDIERWLAGDPEAASELARLRDMSAIFQSADRPELHAKDLAAFHERIDDQAEQFMALRISRWITGAAAAVVVICGSLLMQNLSQQQQAGEVAGISDMIYYVQSQQMAADASTEQPVESQLAGWIVSDLSSTSEGL